MLPTCAQEVRKKLEARGSEVEDLRAQAAQAAEVASSETAGAKQEADTLRGQLAASQEVPTSCTWQAAEHGIAN